MPKIADTVVYRHPCHCASASRAPEPGEDEEHRFDVDGKPFPWRITEPGATFSRVNDTLYLVHVEIFPVLLGSHGFEPFVHSHGQFPTIAGLEFPWLISEDGFTYRQSRKTAPTVTLSFLAATLDVDCEIDGGDGKVWDLTGNLVATASQ